MADMAQRAGGVVHRLEQPWGDVFSAEQIAAALAKHPAKVVGVVLAETSTGAWQPIADISRVVHEAGALLLVDAVTALGGVPVEVDKWQIDAVYAGTQKCLSCPPGLAPVSFSDQAMGKILSRRENPRSWYLDVSLLASYWGSDRVYHHTAPINMTYALHEALRIVLEEGLANGFARHTRNHLALKAGLAGIGIDFATVPGRELPQLGAVRVPEGVDDAALRRQLLERFGIEIGAGLGDFKGKVWRIGLMGYSSRPNNVLFFLAALEQLLAEHGYTFDRGAAVAAANDTYAGASLDK
jgi:alanine-glyoxylate transaminase/serine-glyoxylate transaminase/serine-pyruvate transaminase